MKRNLSIDTIQFKEEGRHFAFSPQLQLIFDSTKEDKALAHLKDASKAQLDYWRKKHSLKEKIQVLGLGRTSKEKRRALNHNVNVPYAFLKNKLTLGKISLTMKV